MLVAKFPISVPEAPLRKVGLLPCLLLLGSLGASAISTSQSISVNVLAPITIEATTLYISEKTNAGPELPKTGWQTIKDYINQLNPDDGMQAIAAAQMRAEEAARQLEAKRQARIAAIRSELRPPMLPVALKTLEDEKEAAYTLKRRRLVRETAADGSAGTAAGTAADNAVLTKEQLVSDRHREVIETMHAFESALKEVKETDNTNAGVNLSRFSE